MRLAFLALFVPLFAQPLSASIAPLRNGDLIVSSVADAFPNLNGRIDEFSSGGTRVQELHAEVQVFLGTNSDLKFSPDGVLQAIASTRILRFTKDGTELPPVNAPSGFTNISLAFNSSEEFFVTSYFGGIAKYDRGGNLLWVSTLPGFHAFWSDLASDQCTLYYLDDAGIRRFNVCTRTDGGILPALLPAHGNHLIILADGTLLVSTPYSEMYRFAPDGSLIRHYTTLAFPFARDPDPNFVWVSVQSSNGRIAKFDLTNDAFAAGPFDTGRGEIVGIAVVSDASGIPAVSPLSLALLTFVLAVLAVIRLRAP